MCDIPLRLISKTVSQSNCSTEKEYNGFVVQELTTRFGKPDIDSPPRPIKGTVIIIPSTKFIGHYLLPLTISQACEQHHIDNSKASKHHSTYIYWQAADGVMMLTLSKAPTDPRTDDPTLCYLICYVTKKLSPSTVTDDCYHTKETSYLNLGLPVQHNWLLSKQQLAVQSRSFYVGCNTDDFLTFCLELQYSTGSVLLSHAGPNSIYNHEKISCKFDKIDMDLSELDFLYLSAGEHLAPTRYLIICLRKTS